LPATKGRSKEPSPDNHGFKDIYKLPAIEPELLTPFGEGVEAQGFADQYGAYVQKPIVNFNKMAKLSYVNKRREKFYK